MHTGLNVLTLDYETRSRVNLKKTGPWPYAEDDSADIMCLAAKMNDEPTKFWVNTAIYRDFKFPKSLLKLRLSLNELLQLFEKADIIEAHNAGFERAITECTAIRKYRWMLPKNWRDKMRCTASRAAAMSLPRSLDAVGATLGLDVQKDKDGKAVMLRLCQPKSDGTWNEDPDDLLKLVTYCIRDVDAEYALSKVLNELSPFELKVWQLDQKINERGIPLDIELIQSAIELIRQYEEKLIPQVQEITGGALKSPKQNAELMKWCESHGYSLPNTQAKTIESSLKNPNLPEIIRPVLEIRTALNKASTAKYTSMLNGASRDGRARDTLMYHGASTGRWTGKRLQPHNYPRKSLKKDTDFYLSLIRKRDLNTIEALCPTNPMDIFSACLRPAIRAPEGKVFIAADFNAIEGRGLAWVAGEEHILDDYRNGKDPYKVVAAKIFNTTYELVDPEQRQSGKVAELACGYRGSVGAARRFGAKGTDKEIKEKYITPWRANRPATVQFWADIEQCALSAVTDANCRSFRCRNIAYGKHGDFLYCRLPSGRMLAYYKPAAQWVGAIKFEEEDTIYRTALLSSEDSAKYELDLIRADRKRKGKKLEEDWAMVKLAVTIESNDNLSGTMIRKPIHGGVWTENIVQALSRDLLAFVMLRLDSKGIDIDLTIHDEILAEITPGQISLENYIKFITQPPQWAVDMPLGAEGWINQYLKKE